MQPTSLRYNEYFTSKAMDSVVRMPLSLFKRCCSNRFSDQWFVIMSTQLIGFSIGGVVRRFLVEPPSMIWPAKLVNCALFNTLHSRQYAGAGERGGITRRRFFVYAFGASFAWCESSPLKVVEWPWSQPIQTFCLATYVSLDQFLSHRTLLTAISSSAILLLMGDLVLAKGCECVILPLTVNPWILTPSPVVAQIFGYMICFYTIFGIDGLREDMSTDWECQPSRLTGVK